MDDKRAISRVKHVIAQMEARREQIREVLEIDDYIVTDDNAKLRTEFLVLRNVVSWLEEAIGSPQTYTETTPIFFED